MSLGYRQETQLHLIDIGLRRSDRHLGAMFSIFGRLYPARDIPPWEQVPRESSSRDRLHRAAAWSAAALIATAAALIALLAAVAVATAGWRTSGACQHARTYPPRPGSGARQGR
jgi:hypothetical protein